MIFRGLVAATVAVALSATPALAAAGDARAASTIPASETVSGAQQFDEDGGELLVYLLAIVGTGLFIWVLIDKKGRRGTSVG